MTKRAVRFYWALACALGFSLLAVLVVKGNTAAFDAAGLHWMATLRGPAATSIMRAASYIGSGTALLPIGIAIFWWSWKNRERRTAWIYLGTVLAGWALYAILKASFARPRPDLIPRLSGAGWWSFPSGHSMSSTIVLGLAVTLLIKHAWSRALVALLILTIAFSRVYLGVHYPSDVAGGILIGAAWCALALGIKEGSVLAQQASAGDSSPVSRTSDSGAGQ